MTFSFPAEVEQLAAHGIMKPPEMQGLTDEQIDELKLKDEWAPKFYPSGDSRQNPDPLGRRAGNGYQPIHIYTHSLSLSFCGERKNNKK